jgi:hypothetical protein
VEDNYHKSGKKSAYYVEDEESETYDEVPGGTRIGLALQAFQLNTETIVVPEGVDDTAAGTTLSYSDGQLVDLRDGNMSALVQGECIRTDSNTFMDAGYRGSGYCQFTYEFLDDGRTVAHLTAEGPVANGDVSTLAITGGTGELQNTVGQLDFYPARRDGDNIVRDLSLDFLGDLTEGYEVEGTLFVDLSSAFV